MLLPSASVFVLLLCNDREVLGPWRNPPWLNGLASVIGATLVLLSMILTATTVFPGINVTTVTLIGGALLAIGLAAFGLVTLRTRRRAPDVIEEQPSIPESSGQWRRLRCSAAYNGQPGARSRCSRYGATSLPP